MGTTQSSRSEAADNAPKTVGAAPNPAINQSCIVGVLVAEPDYRPLPSGVVAASFALTVRASGEKTTSVPVVWYDPPKRLEKWATGDTVIVNGAVVRRFFRAARGLGSSTEVVVRKAELWRHSAKARPLLSNSIRAREALIDGD